MSKEERQTTNIVMNRQSTFLTLDEDAKWQGSMMNLEQIRASLLATSTNHRTMNVMQSNVSSASERTIVFEDRDRKLALMDRTSPNE